MAFYSKKEAKKFELEGQLIQSLKHPNIVECYEIFYDEKNIPYLVLEYCNG